MPGGDRTGPQGQGPMTGRGLGCCRGAWESRSAGGYYEPSRAFGSARGRGGGVGRGMGCGGGRGMGMGPGRGGGARRAATRDWDAEPLSGGTNQQIGPDEISFLKQQANQLADELTRIRQRIEQMEKQ
jgi:hypothetical protein